MELSERKQKILRAIVDSYIETAEPVGSKYLMSLGELNVSSATIRNEMAELYQNGYLEQPHTSAGRIPTTQGYRLYVDYLMEDYRLRREEAERLETLTRRRLGELDRLIGEAGRVLSDLTHYTTVAVPLRRAQLTVRHCRLLKLDSSSIVILLITSDGSAHSRTSDAPDVTDAILDTLAKLINERLCGKQPEEINLPLIASIEREMGEYAPLVNIVLQFIYEATEGAAAAADAHVEGLSNLLRHPEFADVEKARSVMDVLGNPDKLTKAFADSRDGLIQLKIGSENQLEPLQGTSLILYTCRLPDDSAGVLGVVGPTRMNYARVVSQVRFFADLLERYCGCSPPRIENHPEEGTENE